MSRNTCPVAYTLSRLPVLCMKSSSHSTEALDRIEKPIIIFGKVTKIDGWTVITIISYNAIQTSASVINGRSPLSLLFTFDS